MPSKEKAEVRRGYHKFLESAVGDKQESPLKKVTELEKDFSKVKGLPCSWFLVLGSWNLTLLLKSTNLIKVVDLEV